MSRYVVLAEAETSVTSYSSGPIGVGDDREVIVDYTFTYSFM